MSDHMPDNMKGLADFIQRVGFPIFVAISIGVYHVWYVNRVQEKANVNSCALVSAIEKNTEATTALRHFLTHKYDE